ncbi:MAG TPA: class I SAM-dependent methyltransferase [Methylovirgula sp.]
MSERQSHWDGVYTTKAETAVSWFQDSPAPSRDIIGSLGATPQASIIDIGGGASRFVDALIVDGFDRVTVLDLSPEALAVTQARLGAASCKVGWIAADVTTWEPLETYDVWHDRAAFHFLTTEADRAAYAKRVAQAVRPGGHVVIGTFALDGPERCSGLPVQRHDAGSIGAVLGDDFELIDSVRHEHMTPAGSVQRFQFSSFRRKA